MQNIFSRKTIKISDPVKSLVQRQVKAFIINNQSNTWKHRTSLKNHRTSKLKYWLPASPQSVIPCTTPIYFPGISDV